MDYCIQDFGAKPENKNNAIYIQNAINMASQEQGRVIIPKGIYKTGTIILKDNITLYLEEGAVLKASDDISDFDITKKDNHTSLEVPSFINCDYNGKPTLYFIYGENLHNITISGSGTIDGNESIFYGYQDEYFIDGAFYPRMPLLFLENIHHLEIKEVTLANSAFWTTHLVGCEEVHIHHMKIRNNLKLANCDGIDPDHCHHVHIHDCDIITGDDAIVFKNTMAYQKYGDCYDINVHDCNLQSTSGAIKFGSESFNDFYDIKVENITITDTNRGITLQLRDKGNIHDCHFSNINISTKVGPKPYFWGYGEPIALSAVNRNDDIPVGRIYHLQFKDITMDSENGLFLYGEERNRIEDISFENLSLHLHKKTKWDIDQHDLRPYDKKPFLKGKVNLLYLRNASHIHFKNFTYSLEDSIKPYYDSDFDIQDAIDINI